MRLTFCKAILVPCFLLLLFTNQLKSQSNIFSLKIYPEINIGNLDTLNRLVSENDSIQECSILPSYPGFYHEELVRMYDGYITGNLDSIWSVLQSLSLFESIDLADDTAYALGCQNPIPAVNDVMFAQNYMNQNHLSMMEAQCAWSITTGDPNIIIGVADTEIDDDHEDLINKIVALDGPISGENKHGTTVAGAAVAETNNNKGVAAIGYNCSLAFERVQHWNGYGGGASTVDNPYIKNAIDSLYNHGAPVINVSWTGTGLTYTAAEEMTKNGTTLVLGAGNSPNDTWHNAIANIPGVIVVSGVNENYEHGPTGHAHNQWVDICALSTNVSTTNKDNGYLGDWGTSLAAPQVSGTIGLMLSVNPCLAPSQIEDLLEQTTDPIADEASYPGLVGAGSLNAYRAVEAALNVKSTNSLDLYIKDRPEDLGYGTNPYDIMADRDNSPDIWVRNQQDGFANQETESSIEYQTSTSLYVYVRVRNKSCIASSGDATLRLYWSKASSWSSWPQNWDGTNSMLGGLIGTQAVGTSSEPLEAGQEIIYEFEWTVPDPYVYQNWSSCLLARIEDAQDDPITLYPNRIDNDVYYNNNIAMRNITIVDFETGKVAPGTIGGIYYPHGTHVYVGNVLNVDKTIDLSFSGNAIENAESLTTDAEVKLIFDDYGWGLIEPLVAEHPSIEITEDNVLTLLDDEVTIEDIPFPSNTRIPVYIGFNFLIDEAYEASSYSFSVRQFLSVENDLTGGVHFTINKAEKTAFVANAGADEYIHTGEAVTLEAIPIGENATYNWYNDQDVLVATGLSIDVTPVATTTYKLEVLTTTDGYKDYDWVTVYVSTNYIDQVSPNPATNQVTVDYVVDETATASLVIYNQANTVSYSYSIDPEQQSKIIDVSAYQPGYYSLVFLVDGVTVDATSLIVQ